MGTDECSTNEALDSITKSNKKQCIWHAQAIQDNKDNKTEILRDSMLELIVIITIDPDNSVTNGKENEFYSLH